MYHVSQFKVSILFPILYNFIPKLSEKAPLTKNEP